jgi:hypothetical protein
VGNPNPSQSTRFGPGNNANPGGRPKGRSLTAYLREVLDGEKDGKPRALKVAERLVELAEEGDRAAIKDIFERLEGRVTEARSGDDAESSAVTPAAAARALKALNEPDGDPQQPAGDA